MVTKLFKKSIILLWRKINSNQLTANYQSFYWQKVANINPVPATPTHGSEWSSLFTSIWLSKCSSMGWAYLEKHTVSTYGIYLVKHTRKVCTWFRFLGQYELWLDKSSHKSWFRFVHMSHRLGPHCNVVKIIQVKWQVKWQPTIYCSS